MRWHKGHLFAQISATACPPVQPFLRRDNLTHRRKALEAEGHYFEKQGQKDNAVCVISWQGLERLLFLRNCKQSAKKRNNILVPSARYDAQKLHAWNEWARQVPFAYTSAALGYGAQVQFAQTVQVRTPAPVQFQAGGHQRKANGVKKRLSEVSALDKLAEKRVKLAATETPQQQRKALLDILIDVQQGGMQGMVDEIERQLDSPERRLFAGLCTRTTEQGRARLRHCLENKSLSATVTAQQQNGKVKERAQPPKRFLNESVTEFLCNAVETEWRSSAKLAEARAEYTTCEAACKDGFALTSVDRNFFARVRKACVAAPDMPGTVLGLDKTGQLATDEKAKKAASAHDNRNIRKTFEQMCGGTFQKDDLDNRHRLTAEFAGHHVQFPHTMPRTTKEQVKHKQRILTGRYSMHCLNRNRIHRRQD